jgi:hypothetical protein
VDESPDIDVGFAFNRKQGAAMNNQTEANDDDSSVGSLPPPPGCDDEVEAKTKAKHVKAVESEVAVKQGEQRGETVTSAADDEQEEANKGEGHFEDAAAADDDDDDGGDIKDPQSKEFLSPVKGSPMKDLPYEAVVPSPPTQGFVSLTAGSPVGYYPILGHSPPHPYAGYTVPPAAHYPPYPSPHHHPHHQYPYRYPYPSSITEPPTTVRKSPPASAIRTGATDVFPATPASNPDALAGLRNSASAKKVSPKATPSSVFSSTSTPPASGSSSKAQRGLRHFSVMVCKHVEERGSTTYNEVADELVAQVVAERTRHGEGNKGKFDEKNIRRRVYDA